MNCPNHPTDLQTAEHDNSERHCASSDLPALYQKLGSSCGKQRKGKEPFKMESLAKEDGVTAGMQQVSKHETNVGRGQNPYFCSPLLFSEDSIGGQKMQERESSKSGFEQHKGSVLNGAPPDDPWIQRQFRREVGPFGRSVRRKQPTPGIRMVIRQNADYGESAEYRTNPDDAEQPRTFRSPKPKSGTGHDHS